MPKDALVACRKQTFVSNWECYYYLPVQDAGPSQGRRFCKSERRTAKTSGEDGQKKNPVALEFGI